MAYEKAFVNFDKACEASRQIAKDFSCTVKVERAKIGWRIVAEDLDEEAVNPRDPAEIDDEEVDPRDPQDDEEGEAELRLIEEDIDGYAEGLAHSSDDGWFYEDED